MYKFSVFSLSKYLNMRHMKYSIFESFEDNAARE